MRRSASSPSTVGAPPSAKPGISGFGAFGNSTAQIAKPSSAFSQKLTENAAQANALRTLDQRRNAQAAATRVTTGFAASAAAIPSGPHAGISNVQMPVAPAPTTIVVHHDHDSLANAITTAAVINAMNRDHSRSNWAPSASSIDRNDTRPSVASYEGSNPSTSVVSGTPRKTGGISLAAVLMWLLVLTILALVAWKAITLLNGGRRRAASTSNYTFEKE